MIRKYKSERFKNYNILDRHLYKIKPTVTLSPWFKKINIPRKAITSITRMRTGHASLNLHLHRIGVVESPLCRCELTNEGLNHVLFECVLNKNWTQMLYSEINKNESEVKFPIVIIFCACVSGVKNLLWLFIDLY